MKSRVLPLALLLALGVSVFCAFLVKAPKAPDHYFFLNGKDIAGFFSAPAGVVAGIVFR